MFRGEWLGGLRHGLGIYRFGRFSDELALFRGEFRFDHAAGDGLCAMHSGAVLSGKFEDSRPNGRAQLLLPGGGRFLGWWRYGATARTALGSIQWADPAQPPSRVATR